MSVTDKRVERNCFRALLLNPEPDQLAAWEDDGGATPEPKPSRITRALEAIGRAHASAPHYVGRSR